MSFEVIRHHLPSGFVSYGRGVEGISVNLWIIWVHICKTGRTLSRKETNNIIFPRYMKINPHEPNLD
jgi:hypothetical protein